MFAALWSALTWKSRLNREIDWVAAEADTPDALVDRATQVAARLDQSELNSLVDLRLDGDDTPPAELKKRYGHFLGWMDARHVAIFAILEQAGPRGIPGLESHSFGEYDWTQRQALVALCRVAAAGAETARIADRVYRELRLWRWETQAGSMRGLGLLAVHSPKLAERLLELIDEWAESDEIEALDSLETMIFDSPELVRQREELIWSIFRQKGRDIPRSALEDATS